jgi:hypothetical protein
MVGDADFLPETCGQEMPDDDHGTGDLAGEVLGGGASSSL